MRLLLALVLVACGDNIGERQVMQSGSRLRLITYELEDGTRTVDPHVFYDRSRREDCEIALFSSATRRCMPVTAGGTTVFTESTCRRLLGSAPATVEPPRYFIRSFTLLGTALPSRLYGVGVPTETPPLVWRQQDAECLGPFEPDPTHAYYTVGAEIATDELVAIHVSETVRRGELSRALDASDDGWRMPGTFTDERLGEPCTLEPSANQLAIACVPRELPRASYFADATCTQLLVAERSVHQDLGTGCFEIVDGDEPFLEPVFERIGETCVATTAPREQLYRAGDSRDAETVDRDRVVGHRLEPNYIIDGAGSFDATLFDIELGADCTVQRHGGDYACVPYGTLDVRPFFRDAACLMPIDVVFVPTGTCRPRELFAGGRRIESIYPAPIYELTTGDRCAAYAPPARFAVHTVAPVETNLVRATRVVDQR